MTNSINSISLIIISFKIACYMFEICDKSHITEFFLIIQ